MANAPQASIFGSKYIIDDEIASAVVGAIVTVFVLVIVAHLTAHLTAKQKKSQKDADADAAAAASGSEERQQQELHAPQCPPSSSLDTKKESRAQVAVAAQAQQQRTSLEEQDTKGAPSLAVGPSSSRSTAGKPPQPGTFLAKLWAADERLSRTIFDKAQASRPLKTGAVLCSLLVDDGTCLVFLIGSWLVVLLQRWYAGGPVLDCNAEASGTL